MQWPELMLFDHQLASVRSGADRAVFVEDPAPHTIVRRYAVLASSMMLLLSKFETDEQGVWLRMGWDLFNFPVSIHDAEMSGDWVILETRSSVEFVSLHTSTKEILWSRCNPNASAVGSLRHPYNSCIKMEERPKATACRLVVRGILASPFMAASPPPYRRAKKTVGCCD
eukprot:1137030-Pelagomonas_calceolata.AAC.6